jgi:predicted nucleic-acid-binding Zn-ribbon protein
MELSEAQRTAAVAYLSENAPTCEGCGTTDWELGELRAGTAELVIDSREVEPNDTCVEITCRSCGHIEEINTNEADLPEI